MLAGARAAELGEPIVRSHIGQPLVADIELTGLADAAAPVGVRLASTDVYRGANLGMHPILSSLNLSVMRRDGRQFLHITSVRPVETENMHLFLDLTEGSRRNVRAVTLWLTPDPTPAPKPLPAPKPVPLPVPAALPPQALPPSAPAPAPIIAPAPAPQPVRLRPARVINVPSSAMACPQAQFSEAQIKSCAAMDEKNGLLSAQIVALEDKVRQLQLVMGDKVAPPPVPAALKPAVPPPPPKGSPKAAPKEEGGFPWLLLAAFLAALALIGGGIWFMLSRRKGKTVESAAADSVVWYARLASPFKRKTRIVTVAVDEVKDA